MSVVVLLRVGALVVVALVLADAALVRARFHALDDGDDSRRALSDDYDVGSEFRALALHRLAKKALEALDEDTFFPVSHGPVSGRSGSKTPQISALWKTRV